MSSCGKDHAEADDDPDVSSDVDEEGDENEEINEEGTTGINSGEIESSDDDLTDTDDMTDDDSEDTDEDEEALDDSVEIEQRKEVPKDIEFDTLIVSIDCHPKKNLVAAGMIDGPVNLYSFDREGPNKEILNYVHHKQPCRAVRFSESGEYLFTASKDSVICAVDLNSNSVFRQFNRVNGLPLYSLLPIDNYLLAAGEDSGQVVLWDFRMQSPLQVFEDCESFISSFSINKEKRNLIATSGDGSIASYNVRAMKLEMQSEFLDVELMSSGIFKNGTKVAVGGGDGAINIFNFGEFGNISDRFPGHPGSIDSMVVLYEDVICTGCEDGKVRAVQLFPNRILGVLGNHSCFSIEGLALSHDSTLIASCSYDQKIKFFDLSGVDELRKEDVKDTKKKHQQVNKPVDGFFADL